MGKDMVYETYYQHCWKKPIRKKRILFESRTGKEFAANLWYLFLELQVATFLQWWKALFLLQ